MAKGYSLQVKNDKWTVLFRYKLPGAVRKKQFRVSIPWDRKKKPPVALVDDTIERRKRDLDANILVPKRKADRTPLLNLLAEYHESQRAHCSQDSQHPDGQYQNLLRSLGQGRRKAKHRLTWKCPADLNRRDLERHLNSRRNGGTSAGTVNKLLRDWKALAHWLGDRLPEPPFKGIRPYQGKTDARVQIIEPVQKVQELLDACQRGPTRQESRNGKGYGIVGAPEWLHASVLISVYSGLRAHELKALQWDEVDLERRIIHVTRGKGDKSRDVPMHAAILEFLQSVPNGQRKGAVVPWFPYTYGPDGQPQRTYMKAFRTAARLAGVKGWRTFRWHGLRDTFASWSLMGGVPLAVVSQWLGHASIEVTRKHYVAFVRGYETNMIDLVDLGNAGRRVRVAGA